MEVEQEMADEAEDRDAIRTLADVDDVEEDIEMSDVASKISEFRGDTDVEGEAEKEITVPKVPAKPAVSRFPASSSQIQKKVDNNL